MLVIINDLVLSPPLCRFVVSTLPDLLQAIKARAQATAIAMGLMMLMGVFSKEMNKKNYLRRIVFVF